MVNGRMEKRPAPRVFGHQMDPPRLTPLGAALVAAGVAVPGGAIVWLVALVFF